MHVTLVPQTRTISTVGRHHDRSGCQSGRPRDRRRCPATLLTRHGRRLGQPADSVRSHDRPRQGARRGDHHQPAARRVHRCPRARPCASTADQSSSPIRIWRCRRAFRCGWASRPPTRAPTATSRPGRSRSSTAAASTSSSVTNQRPTTGGTDRQAKVVTDDDRKALDEKLQQDGARQGLRPAAAEGRPRADAARAVADDRRQATRSSTRTSAPRREQLTGRLTRERFGDGVPEPRVQRPGRQGARARAAGTDLQLGAPVKVETPGRAESRRPQSGSAQRRVGPAAERRRRRGHQARADSGTRLRTREPISRV